MNKQLQTLLDDSLAHYRGRHLKKALNTAQIALEFGLNEHAETREIVSANLLLARIFSTNARYQNEPSSYQKALHYIAEAKRLDDPASDAGISLNRGVIYLNLKDFARSEACLQRSLRLARQGSDADTVVRALAALSQLFLAKNDPEQATLFAEQGLDFLQKNALANDSPLWATTWLQLSQACLRRQDYARSLEMSQCLLQASRLLGDAEKEVVALHNIAVISGVKSNYKIAMQHFLEALDKCEAIGYRELIVQIQINLGTLYAHLYNYEEAIHRYQSVLHEHGDMLDDKLKTAVYNNLGNIFYTTQQPDAALGYFEKACALAEESKNQEMSAHAFAQLSRTKISLERLDEAAQDAQWAQALFARLGDVQGKQINLLNLSSLAFFKKDFKAAAQLARQAVETARKLKDDACEIRGNKLLSQIFKASGDFARALEFQERYAENQEEFAKVQRSRQFLDLEIRHAIREKQKEIEQLTMENEYQALLLQKSGQIARQNQELLQANDELRHFAHIASHDLKEPLRMIGAYTDIIGRKTESLLGEKERQYFTFVTDGVRRMNSLLDGLLKYAVAGSGGGEFEEVNLNGVVRACLANLKVRIGETKAQVNCESLPNVKGTAPMLAQLFQNLIGNALKFARFGEPPLVSIFSKETENEWIVAVEDRGIGIAAEHREQIFEIFQRLHSPEKYEGTGIGLAICQKIAKRLGGRLWVESAAGEGSTFFFAMSK